jgi:hypothetical protein
MVNYLLILVLLCGMFLEVNVAAIIVITRAVLPGVIPMAILSPLAAESVSVASEKAPVVFTPIENVSLPLEPFFLRTTVEFAVAAVLTRHHRFEIVPAGKGVCASVSDPPADRLLRFGPFPNIKNPCELGVNPISVESPSYATSRLGIAEAIDYLSNTDFQCITS